MKDTKRKEIAVEILQTFVDLKYSINGGNATNGLLCDFDIKELKPLTGEPIAIAIMAAAVCLIKHKSENTDLIADKLFDVREYLDHVAATIRQK